MDSETSNEITDEEFAFASALAQERNAQDAPGGNFGSLRERAGSSAGDLAKQTAKRAAKRAAKQASRALARALLQVSIIILTNPLTWIVILGGAALFLAVALMLGIGDCVTSAGCWKDIGISIGKTVGEVTWDATLGQIGIPGGPGLGDLNPFD